MKHYGDIKKISGYDLPVVDVITGGSPCQDLSVAGTRSGLDGERSGLFLEQVRIVKEMRERDRATGRTNEHIRPRYLVWENVEGAFSSGKPKGADFQRVLSEIVKIVREDAPDVPLPKDGRWTKSGSIMGYGADGCPFSIAWRLHDAQFWGVPQRRKRVALVADFGGLSAAEICFERKGMHGDPEQGSKTSQKAPRGIGKSPNASGKFMNPPEVFDARGNGNGEISPTITGDHQNRITDYTAIAMYNKAKNDQWEKSDKCMSIIARFGTGGGNTPVVMQDE